MGIFRICLCEDISCHSLESEIEVVDIENVESGCSRECNGKVEVAPGEAMGHTAREFRETVSCHAFVFLGAFGDRDYIVVVVVYEPVPCLVHTGISPSVVVSDALSFLNSLEISRVVRVGHRADIIVFLSLINVVGETYEAVVIGGSDEGETPAEIILPYGVNVDIKLESAVAEGSYIGEYLREKMWWNRDVIIAQQIGLPADEVVERTADAMVEHREVNTDVLVVSLFPAKFCVHVFGRSPYVEACSVVLVISECAVGRE